MRPLFVLTGVKMYNEDKNKISHKKIIIIVAAIAAAAVIALLFVFKPWEQPEPGITYTETQSNSEGGSALENPDSHVGEEISFTAEAISDSVNYDGMLVVNAIADNQYVVVINYLDQDGQLSFNTGDKLNATGFITGISLIETEDGNPLSGVEIAANALELAY